MLKRIFALCFLFLCFSPLTTYALTHVKIELKWFHQFQFAGIYAAKEQGIYKKYGLDVEIVERNPQSSPLKEVLEDKVQFGISDSTIIKDYLNGKPVVVLAAIFQHSPLVLISLKDKGIVSPIELKGKRVMYQKDVDEAIINAMFKEFDLDTSHFIFVPHTFEDNAILKDKADAMSAYITNQPFYYQNKNIPINIVDPSNYGIDFYGDLIFTSRKFFENNQQTALSFREATIEGWRYALEHQDEIIQLIKEKYHSHKSVEALKFEADKTENMIAADIIDIGTLNKNRFNRIFQIYKKQVNHQGQLKIDDLLYSSYLKPVNYRKILFIILFFIVLFVATIISLFIFNRQLKKRVNLQHTALLASSEKSRKLIRILDTYVMSIHISRSGRILQPSKDFVNQVGYPSEKLQEMTLFDLMDHNQSSNIKKIKKALKSPKFSSGEMVLVTGKTDEKILYLAYKMIELNYENQEPLFIIVFRDLTKQKKIKEISETDALTQVANRYKGEQILEEEVYRAHRYALSLSVAIIDIDHFKKMNDTYGHSAGDDILFHLSQLINQDIRKSDFFARWGGEEFILVMPNTPIEDAKKVCEKLRGLIASHTFPHTDSLTVSMGVAMLEHKESYMALFEKADKGLYDAKNKGRNKVCAYRKGLKKP